MTGRQGRPQPEEGNDSVLSNFKEDVMGARQAHHKGSSNATQALCNDYLSLPAPQSISRQVPVQMREQADVRGKTTGDLRGQATEQAAENAAAGSRPPTCNIGM